ncbi:MAG: single-stranded DNA-binding protein [Treponemataceae bacterium]
MVDLNSVSIIGRLTRDAELKYTSGGMAVSNFSIAVNRRRKNGDQWVDEVSFFDVNFFGKSAESLKQYLLKGKQIAINGELRQDRWEKDGQNHSRVFIVANTVELLGGGGNSGSNNFAGGNGQYSSSYANTQGYNNRNSLPNDSSFQRQDTSGDSYDPGSSYSDSSFPEDIPF